MHPQCVHPNFGDTVGHAAASLVKLVSGAEAPNAIGVVLTTSRATRGIDAESKLESWVTRSWS